jgi:hypothetical protein
MDCLAWTLLVAALALFAVIMGAALFLASKGNV